MHLTTNGAGLICFWIVFNRTLAESFDIFRCNLPALLRLVLGLIIKQITAEIYVDTQSYTKKRDCDCNIKNGRNCGVNRLSENRKAVTSAQSNTKAEKK